jgi:1,4-alpha-glucan branching enzyme
MTSQSESSPALASMTLNDSYQSIDPKYGDLADWDAIRDACHGADMKIVMDLVVNHTSDQVSRLRTLIE